ncbi:SusD/RagB family nutrient-binding outer membrane lipoprotein [Sinomicrobium weinanense]|uniref:SusD/RagB family nutrient-binding outer membrane lipoprotein n=1 Tax=Sinomicrobium weinanense TaxID=2842200 RepID=A0A926JUH5_9FLAO|nr:SusD/RagB family nutrient-binding outer membrane lipoprotein [Sinomicrobium weinanense]MBC9797762.1 SusD/RagB family nutrient-binding outer membrane lipoprotein [Sinomicrobium weinanense]MBU3122419.1 SusD/RagB family nutrient-binding outer membrane lipoprotein [Sinomicrobium weinanense]
MKTSNLIKSVILLFFGGMVTGCLDYDELRENPNDPVSVQPNLLFTEVTPGPSSSFSGLYRDSQYHNYIAADLGVSPPVNYRYGSNSFNYDKLRNIDKMEEEAELAGRPVYAILAKFLRAYYYIDMSREMGDVPLSDAMKGAEVPQPEYDSQKSVYIQCLNWLDEANEELGQYIQANPGEIIDGDFYFGGDPVQWQKAINSFTIRVLISLSTKANDPDVDVRGRFSRIIANPSAYPLMTGPADNMQITHRDEDGFRGTYHPNNQILVEGVIYADTYIDLLKAYEDPRLFKVADPTPKAVKANPDNPEEVRNDFNSYAGSDISIGLEENNAMKSNGEFSYPNADRFLNFVGQPSILLGYAEQELNIAEAANRGWITEDGQTHYNNGVRTSMEFYGVVSEDIDNYLAQKAPYQSGEEGLRRIHRQMYLAFAENSDWEAWFLHRRTGVPEYKFSGINNVEKFPLRWAYPTAEDTDNHENYRAALKAQFGTEVDDRDQVMWLIRE